MSKIAVDIALLPPEEIMDLAISANKTVTNPRCVFRLNKTDVLPHLSLTQGVMDSKDMVEAKKILEEVAVHTTR
ncbi:MAG: hypothetical protein NUV54_03455 [Candidatus Taylorbacteria bacterium]|nr:hypothetical protein [Candidatus Taylorbacteria bacterium]